MCPTPAFQLHSTRPLQVEQLKKTICKRDWEKFKILGYLNSKFRIHQLVEEAIKIYRWSCFRTFVSFGANLQVSGGCLYVRPVKHGCTLHAPSYVREAEPTAINNTVTIRSDKIFHKNVCVLFLEMNYCFSQLYFWKWIVLVNTTHTKLSTDHYCPSLQCQSRGTEEAATAWCKNQEPVSQ